MASLTLLSPGDNEPPPVGRQRRNSYFEALSSVSSDLNFVVSDLKKAQVPFKASSPKSPLNVSACSPATVNLIGDDLLQVPAADRYQHLRLLGNYSLATNNNASTVSTQPSGLNYEQVPPVGRKRDSSSLPRSFEKSLLLPAATHPSRASSHEEFISPHQQYVKDSMELSLLTRLVHTKPIWFLPHTQRTAAIHYLQGQAVGSFLVCQARDKDGLVLAMKHPGKGTGLYIEKLPILISQNGVKLSRSAEEFSTIEDLILHYLHQKGTLPCKLVLPPEIMAARNIRALQSLALFEEEFWVRNQCQLGVPNQQVEGQRDFPESTGSPRAWSTLPIFPTKQQDFQWSTPPSSMAPSLSSPEGYMVMNKQPVFALQTSAAAKNAGAAVKLDSGGQGMPVVSLRNHGVDSVAAQNRQLHKSWSFDDKNNPFRQSEFMSTIPGRSLQHGSSDDTLLASMGRQPIRCSTQSQQEFLLQNVGHYPPPLHSPPPPPKDTMCTTRSLQSPPMSPPVHRSSVEYYRPFEVTRQDHHPIAPRPTLPPPPKRSASHPPQGPHYQQPQAGLCQPPNLSQYSFPRSLMVPQGPASDYTKVTEQLASLKRTSVSETQPDPSQQPSFGLLRGQPSLAPILKPSVSSTPPPVTPKQEVNPLHEFDPLFAPSQFKEPPSSSGLVSTQDVFSATPPQLPVQADPQSHHNLPTSRYDATVGKLLDLTLDSSEEEEGEKEPKEPNRGMETPEYSSEDLDQEGDDEEEDDYEEGDRMRRDRSSSTADTQSSHSGETQYHIGEHSRQDLKMTTFSDEDHDEQSFDKLAEVKASQTKKIKKLKKKKKMSNFSRIQKYVLRGKTKKKKFKDDPAKEIQAAIHKLASNKSSYFSMMMECFVQNIKDKEEKERPDILIRNIRQFMSGMKNYLFNRREPEVDAAMDKYYNLTMAELDAIVESAIHHYILLPLKPEIYKCFINDHKESGALDILDHNIQLARAKTPVELGIKENYTPPEGENLQKIRQYFHQLEEAYSPIRKLEHLLNIVRTVYDTVVDKNSSRIQAVQSMGADDFLPMFIYVLVQCEVVNVEIEADYMWGLLEPTMLSGEGGYYLTTLSSAICVLKQFEQENVFTETKGFLSVMVALGDADDHVVHKTLPVLPGMNAGDVSRILAHKMKIDNAHQYQLYLISGEEDTPIGDNECPLEIKEDKGTQMRPCFGYKIEGRAVTWFPLLLP
ncbi:ras and Rab interactor 2-like isoform X1 [Acanthaster planci]|uniref:Ras and Rab interactor 2-like isoform X1 n=2 Tax=Acanthaster planci TaxID=133434 RepID=A0A8B7YI51_ACAPL|nr:ras and Rab interactor 2-like isoform X1 [Acanthaster planci]XP_022091302.1 ras and Rab interactor 2-like isoform X1 [Acanthaster planci]